MWVLDYATMYNMHRETKNTRRSRVDEVYICFKKLRQSAVVYCLSFFETDGRKPIHHFPNLVYTEAVSTFVEKMVSHVMLLNERLCHFFYKKDQIFYGTKLIF